MIEQCEKCARYNSLGCPYNLEIAEKNPDCDEFIPNEDSENTDKRFPDITKFISDKIGVILKEYERTIIENVLFRVLMKLYFQDYNKECNYKNMTGADVVKAQHKIIEEIEKEFNYTLDDDLNPFQ